MKLPQEVHAVHPFDLEGYRRRPLALEIDGVLGAAYLTQGGKPAKEGSRRGEWRVTRDDGKEVSVVLRHRPLDPLPQLILEGKLRNASSRMPWYAWLLLCLPVIWMALDPLGGALVGAVGVTYTAKIFRSGLPFAWKAGAAVAITLAAGALYGLLFLTLQAVLGQR